MTEDEFRAIVLTEFAELRSQFGEVRARVDGIPVINRSITVMRQEMRMLRTAFNDFARTNVTAGEIEALHADVDRVQTEHDELATRLVTIERLLEEVRGGR